jgi:hypothetical protein
LQIAEENHKLDSITKLHYHLSGLFSKGATSPLHIFVTYSKTTIEKLPSNAAKMDRKIVLNELGGGVYEIRLRLKKRGASGWLVTKQDLWLFYIKGQESSSVGTIVESWIGGMNPFISHARIPPSGLFDMLDTLNNTNKNGILVHEFLARSYRMDKTFESDREGESQKAWTGAKYDRKRIERMLAGANTVLSAAKVELRDDKSSFVARISRLGHITFYEGQEEGLPNCYRQLVDPYLTKALEYNATLVNKEVQIKATQAIVNPIVFEPAKILGKDDFDDLIEAVTNEPDFMVSILHFGNPWLYLTLVDRTDGNACEIYGFEDEIQLIPQFRATPTGLARIEDVLYGVFPSITKTQE